MQQLKTVALQLSSIYDLFVEDKLLVRCWNLQLETQFTEILQFVLTI